MAYAGFLWALDQAFVDRLTASSDDELIAVVQRELYENYYSNHKDLFVWIDKPWDIIHCILTDGTPQWEEGGDEYYPLDHLILGGQWLYEVDNRDKKPGWSSEPGAQEGYFIVLKTPQQVSDVAQAIASITLSMFEGRFSRIDPAYLGVNGDLWLEWAWVRFEEVREFWLRTATSGRHILLTVDT
jgi:hypothetical protein